MDRLTAHARKALTISIGIVLLVVGVALLILPGPGLPLIIVGLTLLGAHFAWARNLKARAVDLGKQGLGWVKRLRSSLFRPRAAANRPPP
jgi:hypothetical protein